MDRIRQSLCAVKAWLVGWDMVATTDGFFMSFLSLKISRFAVMICLCFPFLGSHWVSGQSTEAAEWRTSSSDPQRDGWQRDEHKLTKENVRGIKLLWKVKTDNISMGMQSFREPLIVAGVSTPENTKTLAILAGSSNDVYAIDADRGTIFWQKHLKWSSKTPETPEIDSGFICTKALTATPVVTPSGVGKRFVYVLGTDGYLHTLNLSTGNEDKLPIQMLPDAYGKAYGLNLRDNIIYTVAGQSCHGVPNNLYAVDITNGKTFSTAVRQGGIFGTAGPAIGTDGTIYLETGDGTYSAETGKLSTTVQAYTSVNDTLVLKDYYTPTNHEWLTLRDLDMNVTPVVFPYKGRDLLVGSGKEGRFFLMDSRSLGGPSHDAPLYRSPLISNANVNFQTEGTWGSLASWKSQEGTRWVLAPVGGPVAVPFPITHGATPNGGIIAFKLTDENGKMKLVPVWLSRDMMTAEPPVVANNVVFVLASGEFTGQADDVEGGLYSWQDRVKRSIPAKLYALDAETGEELYSSKEQVTSFLHQSGIAVAGGRIIFGTFDGTVYCFGLP